MMEEKTPVIRLEQKFKHNQKDIIYIVRRIKDNEILLVSEDGRAAMLVQVDTLAISGLEPLYDRLLQELRLQP